MAESFPYSSPMQSMYFSLKVTSGPAVSTGFVVSNEGPLTFGRLETNDCVLARDAAISRRHFQISFESGKCWIRDLNSRNGTYLNNHSILSSELNSGDEIRVGSTRMIVNLSQSKEPVPPAVSNITTGTRLLFQNNDETTVVTNRSLHTTRIDQEVILGEAFTRSFFDLPGKAIFINAEDARTSVEGNTDFETIGSQAIVVFPTNPASIHKLLSKYIGQNNLILMNHACRRSQLLSAINDSFSRFETPKALLDAIEQLPIEIADGLLAGIDFVCCEEKDTGQMSIFHEKQHAMWVAKLVKKD